VISLRVAIKVNVKLHYLNYLQFVQRLRNDTDELFNHNRQASYMVIDVSHLGEAISLSKLLYIYLFPVILYGDPVYLFMAGRAPKVGHDTLSV
jgi:hypothetical protein